MHIAKATYDANKDEIRNGDIYLYMQYHELRGEITFWRSKFQEYELTINKRRSRYEHRNSVHFSSFAQKEKFLREGV